MPKVKLTVVESRCRSGCMKQGDVFIVEDLCPPICHELWSMIYPNVYVLLNGGQLDQGESRATWFQQRCGDESRVLIRGEVVEE